MGRNFYSLPEVHKTNAKGDKARWYIRPCYPFWGPTERVGRNNWLRSIWDW